MQRENCIPFHSGYKMKIITKIIIAVLVICSHTAYSFDLKDIAAYPVPFNPQKKTLTVDNPAGTLGPHKVLLSIYDINGDLVIKKTLSTFPVKWNGRNSSGRYVKPGLYILKVEVDDDDDAHYGKKIIRILIDY
jgi:hypothetical protein